MDTFPQFLVHNAKTRPDRAAVREKSRGIWQTLTWGALADEVRALAAGLSAAGVRRGDYVGLLGENRPRLFAAMAAVQWLGGVVVPLFADTPADELAIPVRTANIGVVFAENQEQVDKLLAVMPQCPSMRHIIYDDDIGMRHYRQSYVQAYEDLLATGRDGLAQTGGQIDAELARGSSKDPAALFFTSGTTGPARGVVHAHGALIDRARVAVAVDGLNEQDTLIAYLPPAWMVQHMFAYALPMVTGSCVCCPESSETMLNDMREMGPTVFLAPPRVLEALLTQVTIRINNTGGFKRSLYDHYIAVAQRVGLRTLAGDPVALSESVAYSLGNVLIYGPLRDVMGVSRLRVAYAAGEATGPDLLLFYRAMGINLKQLYGSTETGLFITAQSEGRFKPGAVGAAAPGVELSLGAGREVLVRSPGLFLGYHGEDEATHRATHADGWFHTGDAGWLDEDGQLHIVDRMQDIGALTDGSLFAPKLLENKLKFSHYINEAVAFGNGRDRVCVFVDIDAESVGNWADKQGLTYTGFADLATLDEVYGLIGEIIAKANAELAHDPQLSHAQIHRFLLLQKRLEPDDGELTRMRKVRRDVVSRRFASLVQALYDGSPEGHVDAEVRYADGSVGILSSDIKIREAKTFAPHTAQRVA